jgi:transmembrane sensor
LEIDYIKRLLAKYRRGACTAEEKLLVEEWLATVKNEEITKFADEFIDEQLNAVKGRIDLSIRQTRSISRYRNNWLAIAASLLLFASAIVLITHLKKPVSNTIIADTGISRRVINGWVYLQTRKGRTAHVTLSDGSFVTLDASSVLRYPLKFVNRKRPLYLDEGEALFEVAKDKTSPFTVYTPKFATTALGTAFNIRSYAKENKVSISLLHGKIKVEDLHPIQKALALRVLLPHQQVVLNKQSGDLVKTSFDDETLITSWKDGILSFKDATADEVLNSIENRYNVVIANNSSRTNWSYTGTFKNQSLIDVLRTVCLTEGISCTISNNYKVTLN